MNLFLISLNYYLCSLVALWTSLKQFPLIFYQRSYGFPFVLCQLLEMYSLPFMVSCLPDFMFSLQSCTGILTLEVLLTVTSSKLYWLASAGKDLHLWVDVTALMLPNQVRLRSTQQAKCWYAEVYSQENIYSQSNKMKRQENKSQIHPPKARGLEPVEWS